MGRMEGRVVALTGASRGIGAATARAVAAEGGRVALLARDADALAALAGEIGTAALVLPCDVADPAQVAAAVAAAGDAFGPVDVLIGNAGVVRPIGPMAGLDPEAFGAAIDVNLKGVFHGMRAVLPGMLARGGGTVITVSSGAAHAPVEGWAAYCASKAGAAMLTRMLHAEYADRGIRAMGLSPGTVATDMQREIAASGINAVSRVPWDEHVPPEWAAAALVWMCGPEAAAHAGDEVSLRDAGLRARLGLAR